MPPGLAALLRRLSLLGQRARLDRELDEELQSHLQMEADRARAQGASEDEARRSARLRLGNPDRLREDSRALFGFPRLEALARDTALAARRLRHSPGFTLAAVLTLALGIGANAALFALVDAVVLRPLPYPEPERLVAVREQRGGGERSSVAPANIADYRVPAIESLSAWHSVEMDVSGSGRPETLFGQAVSADFFAVLGTGPVLGRAFLPEEDREGGAKVVILSDGLWRSRFGGDPAIVGTTIRLDRQPYQVIGVLPPGFVTPGAMGGPREVSVLVPAQFPAELLANRGDHETDLVARLRPGASVAEADAQLRTVSERLAREFPDTNREFVAAAIALDRDVTREVRESLLLLLGAVAAVLAIACLNVANLQLVRALGRHRELAVCGALGAPRARLVSGLLIESLLVALLGGGAGLGLASVLLAGLKALAPAGTPRLASAALDARVLAVALVATVATGLVFGLAPALAATRMRTAALLQVGARQHSSRAVLRWRGALVSGQVALALALLVAAGLLVRSMSRLGSVAVGFETQNVVAARVALPRAAYPDAARRLAFYEELERRLAARPGVEAVAFASRLPLRGGWGTGIQVEGFSADPRHSDDVDAQAVSRGYFRTLGIPLLRGRGFEAGDREGAPCVGLVNEDYSRLFGGGKSVIGTRFRRGSQAPWVTIVGEVASLRRDGLDAEITPQIYLPAAQTSLYPVPLGDVALRGSGGAGALASLLRAEVEALDPEQPISRVMGLDEALARGVAPRRFGLALLAGFALTALMLTLVGIYGVAAYSVGQRIPELGVRVALGAERGRILGLVVRGVLVQVLIGVVAGLALAFAATRALQGLLFQVAPTDPTTFAAVPVLLLAAAALAALGPALRAARIDPVAALRYE
jgi:putative ABC transport system permease protein